MEICIHIPTYVRICTLCTLFMYIRTYSLRTFVSADYVKLPCIFVRMYIRTCLLTYMPTYMPAYVHAHIRTSWYVHSYVTVHTYVGAT